MNNNDINDMFVNPTDSPPPILLRMGFVLLPQFAMGALAAFADLLGMLDSQTDADGPCAWEVVADTLIPVRSASGVQVTPTHLSGNPARFDYIVVVGGPQAPAGGYSPGLMSWLRQAAKAGCHIVALANGVFATAQAGVMAQHRLCVPGGLYRQFLAAYPSWPLETLVTDRPTVFDRRRISCAGGPAVVDVAARILARHLPMADIQRALRGLQIQTGESHSQVQPPPAGVPADSPPAVRRAMLLIQQYAGQSLTLAQLASHVGVSPRQLQRLFSQHLHTSPQACAREARLQQACWLLRETDKSIATVASDCGFSDAAHMGRSFKASYGRSPGAWRRQETKPKNTV
ncbi:GlxA family transcriptional regulator [Castellaniella sp.]|uniref:GlxA family transcriptional regulator n=1 Tax=Castellaniella sp. TaxID=1955812 RepID=UPI003C77E3F7